jgi:Rab GDP dissociation inhibitor
MFVYIYIYIYMYLYIHTYTCIQVGDPTYFPDKCKATEKVVRCISILSHPITPGKESSAQIILPQAQIGRENDIYVFCVSSSHCVAPEGTHSEKYSM